MKITAILIDDERKALSILSHKLKTTCPNIYIIGEAQSAMEGLDLIQQLTPDLVFLDIAMPEMSGFDLLKKIKHPAFEIIFVTAFDAYAMEAIKHCAIGYLVKPVDVEDLVEVVDRAMQNIEQKTALAKNELLLENLLTSASQHKRIAIPSLEGLEFISINSIIYCEGINGYTNINLENQKNILSTKSIGHFNKLLEHQDFYLVHKSYLINLFHLSKYLNEGSVILTNNFRIPVSRNRRSDFLDILKNR